ncbi:sugar ABC transporter permease [Persicimonas caeni]|uniref:Sugar ABC transporter permease n=1 Tax=Persicimonas caeni TaxID=2292766 RepID=A0A4Y6PPI1_PERCE|nr:sugar ABC transporter permease [Persicimonas caeni]QDG50261.1 sugar ABC transporter permease [Persicimonas caeni]QED31482.1 sugar ABC transporter permease [Persicimonas caeni]
MSQPSKTQVFLTNAALIVAVFVTLYPVLWVVKMALTPSQAFSMSVNPIPTEFSLANFEDLLFAQDMEGNWLFLHQFINSIAVSVATTILGVGFATTAAYSFSRFRFPGREGGMNLLLITQMFPGVVMTIPLYIILEELGLLNSLTGMALVYSTTAVPFCVWMLKGYFDTIPRELEEAAIMDGMGRFGIFTKIILPLAKPGIVVTALFSFMTAWNEFILAATFLSEPTKFTLPVALQRYVGDYSTEWGRFAAGAILVSIPVMALFFALQKHLVGGLTAGSVKG